MAPRARVIPDAELTNFGSGLDEVRDATVSDLAFFGLRTRLRQLRFRDANRTSLAPNRAGEQLTGIVTRGGLAAAATVRHQGLGHRSPMVATLPGNWSGRAARSALLGITFPHFFRLMYRQSEELLCHENLEVAVIRAER